MLNHITAAGRLTKDPELRRTQNGVAVASFTIACDRDIKDASGNKQTDFIDCVAWRNTAEFVDKYFTRGRMVIVSGRFQMREWTDKNGNNRRNAEILAENVYFADSKRTVENTEKNETKEAAQTVDFDQVEIDDDELPF